MFDTAFKFVSENGNFITVIASAVVAIFAVLSTILTAVLAIENRRLRLGGTNPEIVAYLDPHPDGNGAVNFVLANIGQGPAMNVKIELDYDEQDFREHDVHFFNDPDRAAFTVLPQGEKRSFLFGVGYVLFGKELGGSKKILKPFGVRTSYQNAFGKHRSSQSRIDVRQFVGLAGMGSKPPLREIAESIKDIERHVAKAARQASGSIPLVDTTKLDDTHKRKAKGKPSE